MCSARSEGSGGFPSRPPGSARCVVIGRAPAADRRSGNKASHTKIPSTRVLAKGKFGSCSHTSGCGANGLALPARYSKLRLDVHRSTGVVQDVGGEVSQSLGGGVNVLAGENPEEVHLVDSAACGIPQNPACTVRVGDGVKAVLD